MQSLNANQKGEMQKKMLNFLTDSYFLSSIKEILFYLYAWQKIHQKNQK